MARDIRYQIAINKTPDRVLTDLAAEIEVHQSIEKPWSFRIKFPVDICDSDLFPASDPRLQPQDPDTEVSILASLDDTTHCLVHGLLTDRNESAMMGGPGSWIEISGQDRRAALHREFQTTVHEGTASEIAEKILKSYALEVQADPTKIDYREADIVLAQVNSDLDFMDELAGANGMYFWIDYKVSTSFTGSLEITEVAHFANSPPRPQDSSPLGMLPIVLAPDSPPKLTINTNDGCSAIKMLSHKSRSEVINETTTIRRINIDDASLEDTDVPNPTDNALGGAKPPAQKRTCRVMSAGSVEEARVRNQAALNDAAWSVDANADTTVFALGGIVAPHQLIQVAGAGKEKDGEYLIRAVTHHINASDHRMHIELQRNPGGG